MTVVPVLVLGEILAKNAASNFPGLVAYLSLAFVMPSTFIFGWFVRGLTYFPNRLFGVEEVSN